MKINYSLEMKFVFIVLQNMEQTTVDIMKMANRQRKKIELEIND